MTGAPVDADDQAEAAGAAGDDAGHGVLDDDGALRRRRRAPGSGEEQVRCRLAGDVPFGGEDPVSDHVEPVGQAGGGEHLGALRDDDTTAAGMPRRGSWSSSRSEPWYGAMPLVRSTS